MNNASDNITRIMRVETEELFRTLEEKNRANAWENMGDELDWNDTRVFENNKRRKRRFMGLSTILPEDRGNILSDNSGFWRKRREQLRSAAGFHTSPERRCSQHSEGIQRARRASEIASSNMNKEWDCDESSVAYERKKWFGRRKHSNMTTKNDKRNSFLMEKIRNEQNNATMLDSEHSTVSTHSNVDSRHSLVSLRESNDAFTPTLASQQDCSQHGTKPLLEKNENAESNHASQQDSKRSIGSPIASNDIPNLTPQQDCNKQSTRSLLESNDASESNLASQQDSTPSTGSPIENNDVSESNLTSQQDSERSDSRPSTRSLLESNDISEPNLSSLQDSQFSDSRRSTRSLLESNDTSEPNLASQTKHSGDSLLESNDTSEPNHASQQETKHSVESLFESDSTSESNLDSQQEIKCSVDSLFESNHTSTSQSGRQSPDSFQWSEHSLDTLGVDSDHVDLQRLHFNTRRDNRLDFEGSQRRSERRSPTAEVENARSADSSFYPNEALEKSKSDRFELQKRPRAQNMLEKSRSESLLIDSRRRRHSMGSIAESFKDSNSHRRHSIASAAEGLVKDSSSHRMRRHSIASAAEAFDSNGGQIRKSQSDRSGFRANSKRSSLLEKSKSDSLVTSTTQTRRENRGLVKECSLYDLQVTGSNHRKYESEPRRRRSSFHGSKMDSEPRTRRKATQSGHRDESRRKMKSSRRHSVECDRVETMSKAKSSSSIAYKPAELRYSQRTMRKSKSAGDFGGSVSRQVLGEEERTDQLINKLRRSTNSRHLLEEERRPRATKRITRRESSSHRPRSSSDRHWPRTMREKEKSRREGERRHESEKSLYDINTNVDVDVLRKSSRSVPGARPPSMIVTDLLERERKETRYAVDPNERIPEMCRILKEARRQRKLQKNVKALPY
eukprot:CAMPEP_0178901258 /NCGR_PEP_ID=MMETSP0786-20121207/3921_1 /TAXON_ID=186022 /ORGANISM="Thalassionema frauenfeldii, Strain CCMP 1798" /LENGTH=905 /DNA_ID=CAMNT_0020572337 /DNA_START=1 /DNA_END=2718 /DNA_ORIENTATION=+